MSGAIDAPLSGDFARGVFPNGALGAVSLTYDDGPAEHLNHAMPDLEAAGLRGTFYVPTRTGEPHNSISTRAADWRAAAARGHEIGNHTQYHPCSIDADWVRKRGPNFALEAYTLGRMESELVGANRDLAELTGSDVRRSYAYTCCQDFVTPQKISYRDMVGRLFVAGRGGAKRALADPMDLDFRFVPAWMIDERSPLRDITSFIEGAIEEGKWAVLIFHGVGGGHSINVTRETHRAICKHIALKNDELWCDTFANVATRIQQAKRHK